MSTPNHCANEVISEWRAAVKADQASYDDVTFALRCGATALGEGGFKSKCSGDCGAVITGTRKTVKIDNACVREPLTPNMAPDVIGRTVIPDEGTARPIAPIIEVALPSVTPQSLPS